MTKFKCYLFMKGKFFIEAGIYSLHRAYYTLYTSQKIELQPLQNHQTIHIKNRLLFLKSSKFLLKRTRTNLVKIKKIIVIFITELKLATWFLFNKRIDSLISWRIFWRTGCLEGYWRWYTLVVIQDGIQQCSPTHSQIQVLYSWELFCLCV